MVLSGSISAFAIDHADIAAPVGEEIGLGRSIVGGELACRVHAHNRAGSEFPRLRLCRGQWPIQHGLVEVQIARQAPNRLRAAPRVVGVQVQVFMDQPARAPVGFQFRLFDPALTGEQRLFDATAQLGVGAGTDGEGEWPSKTPFLRG